MLDAPSLTARPLDGAARMPAALTASVPLLPCWAALGQHATVVWAFTKLLHDCTLRQLGGMGNGATVDS